jgi:hypothetical protein
MLAMKAPMTIESAVKNAKAEPDLRAVSAACLASAASAFARPIASSTRFAASS